jgi:hypothetical protein
MLFELLSVKSITVILLNVRITIFLDQVLFCLANEIISCVMGATSSLAKSTFFYPIIGLVDICILQLVANIFRLLSLCSMKFEISFSLPTQIYLNVSLHDSLDLDTILPKDKSRQEDWLCWIIRSMK